MDDKALYSLCYYDKRNPLYSEVYDEDEVVAPGREGCFCDNCFRGKHELAVEILRLREQPSMLSVKPSDRGFDDDEKEIARGMLLASMILDDHLFTNVKPMDVTALARAVRHLSAAPADKGRADAATRDAAEYIRKTWNSIAGGAGFAKIKIMSTARVRQIKATIKDHGADTKTWICAIQRYVKSADGWPDRKRFGFDTFIRASKRDQWFEDAPTTSESDTARMTEDELTRFYTKEL